MKILFSFLLVLQISIELSGAQVNISKPAEDQPKLPDSNKEGTSKPDYKPIVPEASPEKNDHKPIRILSYKMADKAKKKALFVAVMKAFKLDDDLMNLAKLSKQKNNKEVFGKAFATLLEKLDQEISKNGPQFDKILAKYHFIDGLKAQQMLLLGDADDSDGNSSNYDSSQSDDNDSGCKINCDTPIGNYEFVIPSAPQWASEEICDTIKDANDQLPSKEYCTVK